MRAEVVYRCVKNATLGTKFPAGRRDVVSQSPPNPPTKDDVLAILKAHRDLGPEFDSHLADQILDLWGPTSTRKWARSSGSSPSDRPWRSNWSGHRAVPVLALSIPLMAIAGHFAQIWGIAGVVVLDYVALKSMR